MRNSHVSRSHVACTLLRHALSLCHALLLQDYLGGGEKVQAVVGQFLGEGTAKQQQDGSKKAGTMKAPSAGFVELHSGSTRPVSRHHLS